jgi:uncharacterized protein YjbI with pentapeptide repeats
VATKSFIYAGLFLALFAGEASLGLLPVQAADCRADPRPGLDWAGCGKKNLMLSGSDFSRAKLVETDLSYTDLRDSNFTGTDLTKAKLARASLAGAHAEKANFQKVEAYRAGFQSIFAQGASFAGAELQRANFTGADLKGASFEKAELSRVIFDQAVLTGTSFASANLARADLTKAIFKGPLDFSSAFLSLTRLEALDLSASTGLEQHQLDMACGDDKTVLPSGLTKPQSWPCADKD